MSGQAMIEAVLDITVRGHFDALHAAGVCVSFEQISDRTKRIVREQQRGTAEAAVQALRALYAGLPDPGTLPEQCTGYCPADDQEGPGICTRWHGEPPAPQGMESAYAADDALVEWRESIGVRLMMAMKCTHEGDDFGPKAVCVTCFDNVQRIGAVVESAPAPRVKP